MTGRFNFISLALLICTFSVSGCGLFETRGVRGPRTGEVKETPTERKKAELFKQIERKFENPEAHSELGRLYQSNGMWTQAEYHYNTTLSFDPVHREAQAAIVKILADSGEQAKSELSAEIYMNQVFASPEDSLRLGLAFQGQGLDEYALDCYRQALHLAPNSAKINRQIGFYYLSKNNKVQAQEYLMRSFQLNPTQPEVAGELGRLGVAVRIPRKVEKSTGKLDKIVEKSDKELSQ